MKIFYIAPIAVLQLMLLALFGCESSEENSGSSQNNNPFRMKGIEYDDGSILSYSYDSYGRLSAVDYQDINEEVYWRDTYAYFNEHCYDCADFDSLTITFVSNEDDESLTTYYDFNSKGKVINIINRSSYGQYGYEINYFYDLDGRLKEEVREPTSSSSFVTYRKTIYTYDQNGLLSMYINYSQDDEELSRARLLYDGNGRVINISFKFPDDSTFSVEGRYYYDSNGKLIRRESIYDDNVYSYTYKYENVSCRNHMIPGTFSHILFEDSYCH